jgi:hypothetical protein
MDKILVWIGLACGCASGGTTTCPPIAATMPAPRAAITWPLELDHTGTPETHRQAVFELLEISGANAAMSSMADVTLTQLMVSHPELKDYEEVMRTFFKRYMSVEAMRDDFATLYTTKFTELQLRQMSAFYRTPTGTLAVRELPLLVKEGASIGQKIVERHQDELTNMVMTEYKRRNP